MQPLQISAKPGIWQTFTARKANKSFRAVQRKVYARDNYTCQFCGFQAREYQEVVNLDQNYRNNKMANLMTACCFCAQCFFLESVGADDFGGGTIICLPELTQAELNSFCHVLFCAMANASGYKTSAQTIYRSLKFRTQPVEAYFGEGSSVPSVFGQLLIEYKTNYGEVDANRLSELRLLPSRTKFKKQIETWAQAAMAELE